MLRGQLGPILKERDHSAGGTSPACKPKGSAVPFTETTWADLGPQGLTRAQDDGRYWTDECDLAYEALATTGALTIQDWRTIVSAVRNGLPVILTTTTMRATVILTQVLGMASGHPWLYHRRWGFASPIYLRDIVSVEAPSADYDV
jgi:hypothetical protein